MTFHATTARQAMGSFDLGLLIRSRRHARRPRMTQAALGALIGYSESWVCRVEKGDLVPPWDTVARIADVLGIAPMELMKAAHPPERSVTRVEATGDPRAFPAATVTTAVSGDREDGTVRRRQFLAGAVGISAATVSGTPTEAAARRLVTADPSSALEAALFQPPGAAPVSLALLGPALRAARGDFRRARYAKLGAGLPGLLATAEVTRDTLAGRDRETASGMVARAYSLACELAIKTRSGTAWVAADRALTAARVSGQAAPLGEAARVLAVTMRQAGRAHAALEVLSDACRTLADLDEPQAQGTRAALLLTAAYTAAQTGDRGGALDLAGEAAEAGGRLAYGSEADHFTLQATPEQCAAFHISIFNALGTPDDGVGYARRIDPAVFPTAERRARFWTDTARMWHQIGRPQQTYAALRAIEQQAPEEARRPSVRALTADLVYAPVSLPGLREYAVRTGAIHG
ncbi:DNA-binding XRE family transcriptional regulator [Streptomyces olivoverticillatus]|uniref:DNA-binding XRE family transcriptional regulator n=1 Tax=Streptomyces olivoverticillatus TaxID=66427 RepID=A0A7W7LJW1_9ACTN|nr:helix-turn-helix transcriptional regulator [Streptomyces olivoverticillatus]MBB4891567.1 DNA-binding XRE family transcriptional regulator [Streptomyces olivoverticillatus]